MLDAEIAATLLNRWDWQSAPVEDRSPLDLLQEGKLYYKHEGGEVRAAEGHSAPVLRIECLTFDDGSRALRIRGTDRQHDWSRWTAVE
jgi:hypothetical protein